MARLSIPAEVDVDIQGNLTVRGGLSPLITRANLEQDSNQLYVVPLTSAKVWDAANSNLPGTPAADDLGLVTGTWGTDTPNIQTGDLKAAGATTRYALFELSLPPEYVVTGSVSLRFSAGMFTTVADTTCTLDAAVYLTDREGLVSGGDICSTAAQSINNLVFDDIDFAITSATLNPGDTLLARVEIACNDAATGTAVIGAIGGVQLLLDIKG